MIIKKLIYLLIGSFAIISCSTDNSGNSNANPTNYLPLTNENYWNYDVETTTNNQLVTGSDLLFVNGVVSILGNEYKKMETSAIPFGFYSSTLRNNGLRVDGSSVKLSGTASYDVGLGTPLNLETTDFIILKEGAGANEQLSTLNGTFTQNISGYDLDFNYTLKSYNVTQMPSFTSNGTVYTDVIQTKVVLNLKITTTQVVIVGFPPITVTILAPQDVLTSNQYYAKNIGMVYADTSINYQLQSIPNFTLPIPSSGSQTQEEFLSDYLVN